MDFRRLPEGPYTLTGLRVPTALLPGAQAGRGDALTSWSATVVDGRLSAAPHNGPVIDVDGCLALPTFVDMHTHLDKGHILPRHANPDGTFDGAISAVMKDRERYWTAEDVRKRMDFALRCAWSHGTSAIRTHIDSAPPQDAISWPVFREMRQEWAGRIALQGVSLIGLGQVDETDEFERVVKVVAQSGGVLGCATYPDDAARARIDLLLRTATAHDLALDLHVDETGDPSVCLLRTLAEAVIETGFEGPVTVGHCCSLAVLPNDEADRTLDLVAQAGLKVVSLPLCNMYLQDRVPGRTPRWRGVTLVHEMAARGIPVSFASDNTRDPFYAYGDLDMVEVMRAATRIAHLDHSDQPWINAFTRTPASTCGFDYAPFEVGSPADLVVFEARDWSELLARPQSNRIVLRQGRQIDRSLPSYRALDAVMSRGA